MIASDKNGKRTLFTIGYEGLDMPDFLQFLTNNKVEVLVDVREAPISRKKGFSKSSLAEILEDNGIRYTHIKDLGSPSHIRKQLKTDWDYEAFFTAYDEYLDEQEEALNLLNEIIEENHRVCLMCFEKTHEQCHRSHVASRAAQQFPGQLSVEPVNTWAK